ncbi:hypothetical protein INR49_006748 [Caranx melampygus]|nr:hypothetical protein INR49_006748 [Caranx melampygus]
MRPPVSSSSPQSSSCPCSSPPVQPKATQTSSSRPVLVEFVVSDAGAERSYVTSFLGIPFAEPPVGKRRFRRAEPKRPWTGVYEANAYPQCLLPVCGHVVPGFQGSEMWNPQGMSEDCLYLKHLGAPLTQTTQPHIHGLDLRRSTGFYSGPLPLDVYDGRYLAHSGRSLWFP